MKPLFYFFICLVYLTRSAPAFDAPATRPTARVIDVTTAAVVGDGVTLNTQALQTAIDALGPDGGTLAFPPGRYLCGTLELRSNTTLDLAEGATLLGSPNPADYRNVDPFMAGDGYALGYAFLVARDAHDVAVVGRGTVDGQGRAIADAQSKPYKVRPFLMRWIRCTNVTLRGVTLRNPCAWTSHFFQCDDVLAENVTIRSAEAKLTNNDGFDVDSCRRVTIRHCDIDSGDDSVCLKATSPRACEDVSVSDCTLSTRCNGIKMGTESLGDFTNVSVTRCTLGRIGMSAVAVYSVDGAHTSNVTISDLTIKQTSVVLSVRLGSRLKAFRAGDSPKTTGSISNVTVRNVVADEAKLIGVLVNGVPGSRVDGLTLENVRVTVPGGGTAQDAAVELPEKEKAYPEFNMFGKKLPASAIYLRHAQNVTLRGVTTATTRPDERPARVSVDVST